MLKNHDTESIDLKKNIESIVSKYYFNKQNKAFWNFIRHEFCTSNGSYRREEKSHKHWSLSPCFLPSVTANFFLLVIKIKSNCMYWMHWKSEKSRTELNELDELKYSKSLTQMTSYAHWRVLIFACSDMYQNIYLSYLRYKKDWAKWAKWARILKNTLTDEQLCSLTCFLVFACSVSKYPFIFPI